MEANRKIQLAAAIAASINQVLPNGFRCHTDRDAIGIVETPGLDTWTCFGELLGQGDDWKQELADAAYAVLNSVQDFVIEGKDFRGNNWPGPLVGKLPQPGAAVIHDGTLEMWFGDSEAPVLKLPSVDLLQKG